MQFLAFQYLLCVIFTHLSGLLIYVTFILYWSLHCTSLSFDPSLACLSKSNLCECLSVGCQIVNAASNEVYASVSMWGVNKEAAEAITHQQPWVCLCMCVCACVRIWGGCEGKRASLAHLRLSVDRRGYWFGGEKADRNEFWSTEVLHSACLSVLDCVCVCASVCKSVCVYACMHASMFVLFVSAFLPVYMMYIQMKGLVTPHCSLGCCLCTRVSFCACGSVCVCTQINVRVGGIDN